MSDAASEVDEQRQMRQVLLRQLELVRRMHAQIELGTGRRAHLVGLLQRMWARLAERVAYTGNDAVTIQQLEDRVRAVCAEVDEQIDDDVASQGPESRIRTQGRRRSVIPNEDARACHQVLASTPL